MIDCKKYDDDILDDIDDILDDITGLQHCFACGKIAYLCGTGCSYKYCPNCGARLDGGTTQQENTCRQLDLYHARKAAGRCPRCGGKRDDNHKLCAACREYQRKRAAANEEKLTSEGRVLRNKKRRGYQKAMRDRRRAEGLCVRCGKPSEGKCFCRECAAKRKEARIQRAETGGNICPK